jgi:hypothetical protein
MNMALAKAQEISLPIQYRDGSAVYFYFAVSSAIAAELMNERYRPALLVPGKALAALCFFEYRDTSIGPYNELGLGLMVEGAKTAPWLGFDLARSARNRRTGFHVLSLPVTSETANRAGQDIWGLPKFVTDISFKLTGRHFQGAVLDPRSKSKPLFSVESRLSLGVPSKGLDLTLFNRREHGNERTVVNTQSTFVTGLSREFSLTIEKGDHPLQATLRLLNLDALSPLGVQRTDRFISQLHGPKDFNG